MHLHINKYILTFSATITAHHLYLTTDQTHNPFAFCKPLAKTPEDRDALIKAVVSGNPKFFLYAFTFPFYSLALF